MLVGDGPFDRVRPAIVVFPSAYRVGDQLILSLGEFVGRNTVILNKLEFRKQGFFDNFWCFTLGCDREEIKQPAIDKVIEIKGRFLRYLLLIDEALIEP